MDNRHFLAKRKLGIVTLLSSLAGLAVLQAPLQAQSILQEEGALEPLRDEYPFEGTEGQAITIELESAEFDTVLYLIDPSGNELEMNDDYGGSLNSTIVLSLPETGQYTAVASSFSGEGGSYAIRVRTASEYELVYDRALELMSSEDYSDAIEAYTAAISIDDSDPNAYLGRADAYWGEAYLDQGETFQGPESLTSNIREAILSDYEQAAALVEGQGDSDLAAAIREQAQYVRTGALPDSEG